MRLLIRILVSGLALSFASATAASAQTDSPLTVASADGTVLAGTLYLPPGEGPYPVTILTHGSERGGRMQPGYLRWAERIRGRGIGVLVFDKRGVGESAGEYVEAPPLGVPASDVLAWVELLRVRDDVRADGIGVLGWSQGGWTGPLAASRSPHLSFVVAISGPGVSPLEQNIYDKTNRLMVSAPDANAGERGARAVRLVMTYAATGANEDSAQAAWDAVAEEPWFESAYQFIPMFDRETGFGNPRFEEFLAHNLYDPVPALERVGVPMLAVFGGADRIVPVEASIRAMRAAFERGDNPDLTVRVFDGANHGVSIRRAGAWVPAPGYHETVLDWLVQVAGSR